MVGHNLGENNRWLISIGIVVCYCSGVAGCHHPGLKVVWVHLGMVRVPLVSMVQQLQHECCHRHQTVRSDWYNIRWVSSLLGSTHFYCVQRIYTLRCFHTSVLVPICHPQIFS